MSEKREVPYTKIEPLPRRLSISAGEHGYHGLFGIIRYGTKYLFAFYLGLVANISPYSGLRVIIHRLRGVRIGRGVLIGQNVVIDNTCPNLITLEDGVSLAGNNIILAHSKPFEYYLSIFNSYVAPVKIKKNAWITVGVTILAGVTVGEGSVVAANSVVAESIPPHCLAAGNPARVIKYFEQEHPIKDCTEQNNRLCE